VHDWTFSYWFLYGRNPAPPPPRWDVPGSETPGEEPDDHGDSDRPAAGRRRAPHELS